MAMGIDLSEHHGSLAVERDPYARTHRARWILRDLLARVQSRDISHVDAELAIRTAIAALEVLA